jgi:hypothetical protein
MVTPEMSTFATEATPRVLFSDIMTFIEGLLTATRVVYTRVVLPSSLLLERTTRSNRKQNAENIVKAELKKN